MSEQRRWYAVHTQSNFEKRLSGDLGRRGVETFLPLIRETHRWKDRRKTVESPVFPGYVFVRIADAAGPRLEVLRSSGAVRILGHGGDIEPVPEYEIEGVRRLVESPVSFCVAPFLREGSRVRVRRGPLEGVEGFLDRFGAHSRLVLSVELLSRSVAAEVDLRDVEVIRSVAARA